MKMMVCLSSQCPNFRYFRELSLTCVSSDTGPDDPIMQPTNRGNKLQANARYVKEGAMGYVHPEDLYKQVLSAS
jgi:hypothetical protein